MTFLQGTEPIPHGSLTRYRANPTWLSYRVQSQPTKPSYRVKNLSPISFLTEYKANPHPAPLLKCIPINSSAVINIHPIRRRRPGVIGAGANDAVVGSLLLHMRGPAGEAGHHEDRRE